MSKPGAHIAFISLLLPFMLSACARQSEMAQMSTVTVPSELAVVQPALLAAWRARNADAILAHYAPNIVIALPDRRLSGHVDVRTNWIAPGLPTMSNFVATPMSFTREGNDIIEIGRYSFVATENGQTRDASGQYANRWQRQPDGTWRVVSATIQ